MNINILHLLDGAKKATGIAVIIDVFRAFSMEAYMMAKGAKSIIPVGDCDVAYRIREERPDILIAGERHGKILSGFDIGNSPWELSKMDIEDKTIVHTTSAGTQGIANARGATVILCAGLVNAKATADYIRKSNAEDVSLVCMGLEAKEPTDEDTLCAEYIRSLLLGDVIDIKQRIERLKYTSGAKFFDKEQNNVFPEMDFYMCTELDKFDFVLKLNKDDSEIAYIEKISN